MNKRKICFVVSSVLTAKFFLRYHIEKLSTKYDIYLVGNFSKSDIESISYFKIIEAKSINIERKIHLLKDFKSVFELKKYYKQNKFDAIHSLAPKAGLISALAGKLAKIDNRIHIFTGQVWHTKKGIMKTLLKNIDRFIVHLNTITLIDSLAQKEYLIKNKILKNENSFVLGKGSISGVDINRFNKNDSLKEKQRIKLGIPNDALVFIFMGRINEDKGIYDLANAFDNVSKKNQNVYLLIVGYDEDNHVNKINSIYQNNQIIYFGSTDKPEDIIHVGDVFCLPSYREGFGTSVIEASSCGLAILCSDTYGLKDTILENKTGLRHQVGNRKDIEDKIEYFIKNKNVLKDFGKNGIEYVNNNFTASNITNKWIEFYSNLLNK